MNYIFDGEIHALNSDYAYISKLVGEIELSETDETFTDIREDFLNKYVDYLIKFNKNRLVMFMISEVSNHITFIYRPPWLIDLNQKGVISLKFRREEND